MLNILTAHCGGQRWICLTTFSFNARKLLLQHRASVDVTLLQLIMLSSCFSDLFHSSLHVAVVVYTKHMSVQLLSLIGFIHCDAGLVWSLLQGSSHLFLSHEMRQQLHQHIFSSLLSAILCEITFIEVFVRTLFRIWSSLQPLVSARLDL